MKEDGSEYYEYMLMYVDDVLAISTNAKQLLKSLEGDTVKYKNGKIDHPDMYLGATLKLKALDGIKMWTITSAEYVNAAVSTIKEALKGKTWKLPGRAKTPMSASFLPELDGSPELNLADVQFY